MQSNTQRGHLSDRALHQLAWILLVWMASRFPTVVHGQDLGHQDISIGYLAGQVVSLNQQEVVTAEFPISGIARQFTSNPGFASESDTGGGIGPNDSLIYHVTDSLLFWDGTRITSPPSTVQIRIRNNPPTVPDTLITATSGRQQGQFTPPKNRIGKADASGQVHSHVNFFLEPNDVESEFAPNFGAYGFEFQLETDDETIAPSEPFVLVFNFGLGAADFTRAVEVFRDRLDPTPIVGDFNQDSQLDAEDINLLTEAILNSASDLRFDLTKDGQLTSSDRLAWVTEIKSTYLGDANLDGEFNTSDLVRVFQSGEYEDVANDNSTWADGDWNGDREFDTADIVAAFQAGGYETGPRMRVTLVPEPTCQTMLLATALGLRLMNPPRRQRQIQDRTT